MQAGLYRHYKGGLYQVLGVAEHTDTTELLVIYVALDASLPGPRLRARPKHEFDSYVHVQKPSGEDSGNAPRFQYIGF